MRGLGIHQRRDDVTQRSQRQIDLGSLLQAISCGTSLSDEDCKFVVCFEELIEVTDFALTLTARQIDQIQLAHSDVVSSFVRLAAFDHYGENGVRSRRGGVHERGAHGTILLARLHDVVDF